MSNDLVFFEFAKMATKLILQQQGDLERLEAEVKSLREMCPSLGNKLRADTGNQLTGNTPIQVHGG